MKQGDSSAERSSVPPPGWHWMLAGILILAVVARLAYSLGVCRAILHIDPTQEPLDGYHLIAEHLYKGAGYRILDTDPPTVSRPPAYPLFLLGIFSVVGINYVWVQIAQAILGAVSCWFLFLLGRWILSTELGLVAAALYAVYPNSILYSARLYAENLYFPLFLAFALVLCRASLDGSLRRGLLAGALWGASLLTRGTLLALPLLLPLGVALSRAHRTPTSRWLRWSVPALLAGMLVIAPWTIRNYTLTGAIVPVSSWAWVGMYNGTQVAKQMHRWNDDLSEVDNAAARRIREEAALRFNTSGRVIVTSRDEVTYDRIGRDLTLEEWRADPLAVVGRTAAGFAFTWFFAFDARMRHVSLLIHLPIFLLFVSGAILMARRHPAAFERAWPALGLVLFTNAFYALAYPHIRYMAGAVGLSFIFAAMPLLTIADGLRRAIARRQS